MGINVKEPLNSDLFTEGFINDETPLDEYNLNLLIAAIKLINENTNKEVENRTQEYTRIQTQVNNEKDTREAADKKLYGADIPEENYLTLTGIAQSLADLGTSLQTQLEAKENTFDVIITDGGGVPQSVIDGTNTKPWCGEYDGWTFGGN